MFFGIVWESEHPVSHSSTHSKLRKDMNSKDQKLCEINLEIHEISEIKWSFLFEISAPFPHYGNFIAKKMGPTMWEWRKRNDHSIEFGAERNDHLLSIYKAGFIAKIAKLSPNYR